MSVWHFGEIATVLLGIWTAMTAWNWGEIAKILLGIWATTVATLALQTWRRQSKAQIQTKFMDDLADSVLELCDLLKAPIELVRFVKMDIESLAGLPEVNKTLERFNVDNNLENAEAITYIEKHGKQTSVRLQEYLKPCAEPMSKIHSLLFKGQVFEFKNYQECRDACRMITWQYDRINAICAMIGSEYLYWPNPKIQEQLRNVVAIEPDDIENHIKENSVKFVTFLAENYRAIYSSSMPRQRNSWGAK